MHLQKIEAARFVGRQAITGAPVFSGTAVLNQRHAEQTVSGIRFVSESDFDFVEPFLESGLTPIQVVWYNIFNSTQLRLM